MMYTAKRRTFEAAKHPKGSAARETLNKSALTSEYMPSYKYVVVNETEATCFTYRTKGEAEGRAGTMNLLEEAQGGNSTPGPWYEAKTGNHQGLIVSEKDGRNIAVAYDKKDAPLIAAAPKLLEALKMFMAQYDIPGDRDRASRPEIRAAYEALAQVEGRS